jgi:DNA-binding CsgD family transcriptional regulator
VDDHTVRAGDLARWACAMFAVDHRHTIITWNAGAEALLGRKADAAIGKKCYEVIGGRSLSGQRLCCAGCGVGTRAQRKPGVRDFDLVVQDGEGQRRILTFSTIGLPAAVKHCTVHAMRLATSCLDRRTTSSWLTKNDHWHVTHREGDVLRVLIGGGSTSDIANQLCVSPLTVRTHIRNLLQKHNLHSRAQLVIFALRKHVSS